MKEAPAPLARLNPRRSTRRSRLIRGRGLPLGRRSDLHDRPAGEPVERLDQRVDQVEKGKRQIGQREDSERRKHVGPAGIPRHER